MTQPGTTVRALVDGRPAGGLPVDDAAIWTGMGVFETVRTARGRIVRLDEHLQRLDESAHWMGWVWDRQATAGELAALGEGAGDWKVNVLLTERHRVVTAVPLDHSRVGAPVRCATVAWEPLPWLPGFVKHTSRMGWILAVRDAARRLQEPVDEVIWTDAGGTWLEANRSNIVGVRDGAIWTPPLDGRILAGITRSRALDAARELGLTVHEAPMPASTPWDELYLCSTLKELAPVTRLNGRSFNGEGPVGRRVGDRMLAELATDRG
ncbi:MAG: hypothetical protein EXR69_00880 [Myxococcales bacterium]|nr:hypothetical protein [Myxococcales bacterium]